MYAFRHLLLCQRQQTRSYLVRGVGAQEAYPLLFLVSLSPRGRSNRDIRCSSSLVWRRSSVQTIDSVEVHGAKTIEQVWEKYFADPMQWWDIRVYKINSRSPDFKHKVTKKALWVNAWSTPTWVHAKLEYGAQSKSSFDVVCCTNDSQEIVQPNRLRTANLGRRNTSPTIARESKRCLKPDDLNTLTPGLEGTIESRVPQNTYVANKLLSEYIRWGRPEDARRLFAELVMKDVVSWNIMIGGYAQLSGAEDAMEAFNQMQQEGVQPNAITYLSILKACASPSALKWGKEVHAYIRRGDVESNVRVGTALLRMYAKCASIDDARLVFDRMEKRDVVSWTVMIGAYAESGRGEEAYRLFLQMIREGFKRDAVTYLSILNACASAGALEWGKEVHSHARDGGFESDARVGSALVHMYAKCGSIDDARVVFDRLEKRNVISWNVIIGAYAKGRSGEEAYRLFLQMTREGFRANVVTYLSILNAGASAGALEWAKEVHSHVRDGGFESDLRVANALVHMYAKCGSIDNARLVFDRMEKRNIVSWNVMIDAYARSGSGEETYGLFLQMIREGFQPDSFTYVSILNACASAGALDWAKELHRHAREGGFASHVFVGNALVHTYAKCGSIDDARLVFETMDDRDVVSWNVMIGGLAQHGCGSEALEVFRKMKAAGVKPDGSSFVAVLSACSHSGLVDEGRRLFVALSQDYGIVSDVQHWTCMVDILGRAGHLKEAKLFIDNMPVKPNAATWGALLGACRSHGNVELGELAARECLKLKPEDASAYVLLSNIYAAAGKWEKVSWVRSEMQHRGIRKEPGCSWIEVEKKIHAFVTWDTSHPEIKDIYAELSRLTEKIKAEGYLPDTRPVLHDIDEEDKKLSLCSHSEKLAIVYGLMRTPSRKSICVYKNLRVCSDCHMATKLISKVTKRDIVVRDANRFHHFKDGLCSCKDYW